MTLGLRDVLLSMTLVGVLALPATAWAQQKTAKQCNDEWTANKAAIQASGKKKSDFVAACRAGQPTAGTASATGTASGAADGKSATTPPAAKTAKVAPPSSTAAPAKAGTALGAGQFSTEAQAKSHCPGDTVVWANNESRIYHFSGNKAYGTTKSGAYMCEKETAAANIRAAKNEKHP